MTAKRAYLVLLGVLGLLFVGLIAGTYGANQLLTSHATQLISLKAQDQALSQEQLSLVNAENDVKKYSSLNEIATAVVPQDKDQAEAVREIVNLAATNNVKLASITFPASTLGNGTTGVSTQGAVAPTAASAGTNVNSVANATSQLQAVPDIPGVYDLQITVTGDPNQPVQYESFINFLSALEHDRRTAQISTITLQPDSKTPSLLTFDLTLNEYIKP
jgi:hypothetical protein